MMAETEEIFKNKPLRAKQLPGTIHLCYVVVRLQSRHALLLLGMETVQHGWWGFGRGMGLQLIDQRNPKLYTLPAERTPLMKRKQDRMLSRPSLLGWNRYHFSYRSYYGREKFRKY